MIAYGITKAATHHLVLSLSQAGSGLPNGTTVAGSSLSLSLALAIYRIRMLIYLLHVGVSRTHTHSYLPCVPRHQDQPPRHARR